MTSLSVFCARPTTCGHSSTRSPGPPAALPMADERARRPATQLAFSLGKAQSFSQLTRARLINAGKVIGVNEATATRELDRLVRVIPVEADKLLAGLEANMEQDWSASPDPENTRAYAAGELRILRAVQKL